MHKHPATQPSVTRLTDSFVGRPAKRVLVAGVDHAMELFFRALLAWIRAMMSKWEAGELPVMPAPLPRASAPRPQSPRKPRRKPGITDLWRALARPIHVRAPHPAAPCQPTAPRTPRARHPLTRPSHPPRAPLHAPAPPFRPPNFSKTGPHPAHGHTQYVTIS